MPSPFPPHFEVDEKQMPEIKDWAVGEKYRFIIEAEQKSMHEDEDKVRAGFDIVAYKYLDPSEEMTDEEIEEVQGEALSTS